MLVENYLDYPEISATASPYFLSLLRPAHHLMLKVAQSYPTFQILGCDARLTRISFILLVTRFQILALVETKPDQPRLHDQKVPH